MELFAEIFNLTKKSLFYQKAQSENASEHFFIERQEKIWKGTL